MILVTGGLGFIGTHTTRVLLGLGADVVVGQRRPHTNGLLPDVTVESVDCTDIDSLREAGKRHRITTIVHLAAAGLGDGSVLDKLWADTRALFAVLHVAREWEVERIVLASTIGVYGGVAPGKAGYSEDVPLPVASVHAIPAAKKIAETVAAVQDELDPVAARIGAVWGPLGRAASPFIAAPQLVHAAVRGTAPSGGITPHADDAIDMLYAPDCGRALALLATATGLRHTTYNVGGGRLTTNREVAGAISRARPDAAVTLAPGRSAHAPERDAHLNIDRLRSDTGFEPEHDIDRAVADYAAWLDDHSR